MTTSAELRLRVRTVSWQAEAVVSLTLTAPDGTPLPAWDPGAHIELGLPSGLRRQYSLCGDPADRERYTVAVRRDDQGRGGSTEIHGSGLVGRELSVSPPRNHFALGRHEHYLLIAGGIGITPLLPMAAQLRRRRAAWSAIYCGRGAATMPFRGELSALGEGRVRIVDTSVEPRPDLTEAIHALPPGAVVYCCGPNPLLDDVVAICGAADVACETEHFAAATPTAAERPDDTVELELRRSGAAVTVGPDTTLLQAIRDAGIEADSDCEEGYCGTCEAAVLEGVPDHRDTVLSKAERELGRTLMPCVSRARTRKIVLDL
jgi:ferredoxin-NADP reductase